MDDDLSALVHVDAAPDGFMGETDAMEGVPGCSVVGNRTLDGLDACGQPEHLLNAGIGIDESVAIDIVGALSVDTDGLGGSLEDTLHVVGAQPGVGLQP